MGAKLNLGEQPDIFFTLLWTEEPLMKTAASFGEKNTVKLEIFNFLEIKMFHKN